MKRASMLAFVGLAVIFFLTAMGALADQEPNDDYSTAETLPGATVTGAVTYQTDEADYYKFTVSEGQSIAVTFKAGTGSDFLYGTLADWDEWTIIELKSKDNVADSGTYHTSNETAEATWYFYVQSDTEGGSYEFTVTLTDQDDGGFGKDAGGAIEYADDIPKGASVSGLLADADEEDWYRFSAGEGDIINVTLTSDADADFIYLDLLDWEGWTIFQLKSKDSVAMGDMWYTALENTEGYWYLQVSMDTDMGAYDLTLSVGHQNDAASQQEAPGSIGTAMELAPGTYAGHLEDEDVADWYKFQMGEGDRVHVTFSSDAADDFIYVELRDWEDWTLWSLDSKGSEEAEGWYWTAHETDASWYYLVVEMDTAPGGYDLDFEVVRQDDGGKGQDAGAEAKDAVSLTRGTTLAGHLQDLDEVDVYTIHVTPGDVLIVTFTSDAVDDQTLTLKDAGESTLVDLGSSQGTEVSYEYWTANETEGGTWLVVVDMTDNPSEAYGAYTFKVTVGHQDDAGSREDVPATDAEGYIVQAGTYTSRLGGEDMADAYRVPVQVGWTVTMTLTNPGPVGAEAGIIGDCGSDPFETLSSKDGTPSTWEGIIDIPTAADGYLCVVVAPEMVSKWEPGSYELKVEVVTTPADTEPPQLAMDKEPTKTVEGKARTISVTVTDNEGIDRVVLYYRIDDDPTWSELAMTADGDTYSATVPKGTTMDAARLEYVIVAWDTAGNNETYGEWTSPKSMKVTEPPDEDGPGFGAMLAVASLAALASGLARRRR